jgi:hypothetical protein
VWSLGAINFFSCCVIHFLCGISQFFWVLFFNILGAIHLDPVKKNKFKNSIKDRSLGKCDLLIRKITIQDQKTIIDRKNYDPRSKDDLRSRNFRSRDRSDPRSKLTIPIKKDHSITITNLKAKRNY